MHNVPPFTECGNEITGIGEREHQLQFLSASVLGHMHALPITIYGAHALGEKKIENISHLPQSARHDLSTKNHNITCFSLYFLMCSCTQLGNHIHWVAFHTGSNNQNLVILQG